MQNTNTTIGPVFVFTAQNVGPNQSEAQHNYGEPIATITTIAPRTNSSQEVRLDGWLGQNNDTTYHAWGQFESIDEARTFCGEQGWSERVEVGEDADECAIESYTTPRATREHWEASDWFQSNPNADVTQGSTDEEISAMAERYQSETLSGGVEVSGIEDYLTERRALLVEQSAE